MKKKTKRKIITLLFIAIFLAGSYFVDKDFFNDLKDTIFKEVNNAKSNIEKEIKKASIVDDNVEKIESIELNEELMVFFLDVGQADSILVKSQDEYMLIDAGNNGDGPKLVDYFNSLGIKELKYVVGTHAHEDHIGGMDNIIKNFKIKNFYMPDVETTTQTFVEVLDALEKKKVAFKTPKIGTKLKLGESEVEVLYVGTSKEDLNDTSIVLKLTYKDVSFLFTGDATNNVEREILDKDLESTVLKVGHHGSKYSSSASFLNKVRPKYAIISCGVNNDYGHPHDVVIKKLKRLNSTILQTNQLGTIVVISDGTNLEFKNIKTNTNGE